MSLPGNPPRSFRDVKDALDAIDLRTNLQGGAVSALPANPADGQEVMYLADGTNGIVWHLRYRKNSASAYKWEFVGGGDLYALIATNENLVGVGAWADLATVGPSITVPLAGDYMADWGVRASNAAAANVLAGLNVAGANPAAADRVAEASCAAGHNVSPTRFVRLQSLNASNVLKLVYQTNVANTTYASRVLRVRPVRVG